MITSASSTSNRSQCSTQNSKKHQYLKGNSPLNKSNLNFSSKMKTLSETPQFTPRLLQAKQSPHRQTNSQILGVQENLSNDLRKMNRSCYFHLPSAIQITEEMKNNSKPRPEQFLLQGQYEQSSKNQQYNYAKVVKHVLVEDDQESIIESPGQIENLKQPSRQQNITQTEMVQSLQEQCNMLREQLIISRDTVNWLKLKLNVQNSQSTNTPNSQQKPTTYDLTQSTYNSQLTQMSHQNQILTNKIKQLEQNELNFLNAINSKIKVFQDKENTLKNRILGIEKILKDNLNIKLQDSLIQEYVSKLTSVQAQLTKQSIIVDKLQHSDRANHLKIKVEKLKLNILQQKQQIDYLISVNEQQLEKQEGKNDQCNVNTNSNNIHLCNSPTKSNTLEDKINQMQQRVDGNNLKVNSLQNRAEISINFIRMDESLAEVQKETEILQGDLMEMSEDYNQTIIDRLFEFQGQAFDLGNFIDEQL